MRLLPAIVLFTLSALAAPPTRISISPDRARHEFQGLGAGAIFYEGHITSLAARNKLDRQKQLFDDMFAKVPTRYLQLMIRATHEPQNDNADPYTLAFKDEDFKYAEHTLAIAKAARERNPKIEFLATLYTPPPWMKTNDAESAGGNAKATLKPRHELEFAEYIYAFLTHMKKGGIDVKYVSISNECDWPHEQPGCFFTPDAHADLFKIVGDYFEKLAVKFPDVPKPILVGPSTLSAPGAVKDYIPAMQRKAGKYVAVLASHDYDPRGDRWGDLQRIARGKPVWMTEWCARDADESPGQINSATLYAKAMCEAFTGGANAWFAYDWAYPPRKGGEALIHIDWGNDYELKKPYWAFRQFAAALTPGMRIVDAPTPAQSHLKSVGFVSADKKTLVLHVVNLADAEAAVTLGVTGAAWRNVQAKRTRTSATEDCAELAAVAPAAQGYADTLPARSVTTYVLNQK
jgi:O-glycosyl hydrolase